MKMMAGLDEFGINKVIELINEIYNSGEVLEELNRSIFYSIVKEIRYT